MHEKSLATIFHPTDFSQGSEVAFGHALKLAITIGAKLAIMHVSAGKDYVHRTDFPGVRSTLARWGVLPEGVSTDEIAKIGLKVSKIRGSGGDPVDSILRYLDRHPAELIVLATHQREGLAGWLHKAVAEPITRGSGMMSLFVPEQAKGFISLEDGTVTLESVLIPVDHAPRPDVAVEGAAGLALGLGCDPVSFTLVHVSEKGDMPKVRERFRKGWTWERIIRSGNVVEQILEAGTGSGADLIVLATQGRQGFLDALLGSTSERVVRNSRCPVLSIPVW